MRPSTRLLTALALCGAVLLNSLNVIGFKYF
jgi:hypothetical protein